MTLHVHRRLRNAQIQTLGREIKLAAGIGYVAPDIGKGSPFRQLAEGSKRADVDPVFRQLRRGEHRFQLPIILYKRHILLCDLLFVEPDTDRVRSGLLPARVGKIVQVRQFLLRIA